MGKNNLYDASSVVTEDSRTFCRRVPSTYLGSSRTNSNLIKEIFANCVDEAVIGHGDTINIDINTNENIYCIEDFGQGFLINEPGIDKATGKPMKDGKTILQRSFDTLNTSGKTTQDGVYEGTSLGLNGIGAKLTNWLSLKLNVITYRDGEFEEIDFKDGLFKNRKTGKIKHASGTKVTWSPDPQFFAKNEPDMDMLKSHFEIISALCPTLTINLTYNGKKTVYKEPDGLTAYIGKKVEGKELFSSRFICERVIGKDALNICITYTSDYGENIDAYVNLGHTDSGEHIKAFHTAFVKAINKYATDTGLLKKNDKNFTNNEIGSGLYVAFNMTTTTAKYDAQNKSRIDDIDAKIITSVIGGDFATWLMNNPDNAKIITERALTERKAREAAQKAKEKIRDASNGKGAKSIFADLPSKLSDAYPKNRKDRSSCELYICEGDSAASSINAVKNSEFQAVFPIRGKILNCQKATPDKVYGNAEISNITKALGLDIDKTTGKLVYNEKKLRYDRIIIACFTGDTKVKSLDGNSYTFKELVDNNIDTLWVYSIDNHGNVVPSKAYNIRKVNTTNKLVKITLDNGEVITCTPDHFILNADGNYVKAEDLRVSDSLMPLYTKIEEDGHEQYFDKTTGKYIYTHKMVAENLMQSDKQDALLRLEKEEHLPNQNGVQVHHKNLLDKNNKLDNRPENLEWVTIKEHFTIHGQSGYTCYNVSDKHRNRVSELHKQGVYKNNNWRDNGYNGSEKHIQAIKNATKRGVYDGGWDAYNQSDYKHQIITKVNQSQIHKDSVKQTLIAKSILFLLINNLDFDEYNYNFYRCKLSPKYSEILSVFDSYEEAIAYTEHVTLTDYRPIYDFNDFTDKENIKNRIAKVIHRIISEDNAFTEHIYNQTSEIVSKIYKMNIPSYNFITKYFDSYELAFEAGQHYNHTITNIEYISVENEPVYCMNVEKYHNFALDSGIFVKNCDEDTDGSAIASLLLTVFNWLCPELIENGKIYRVHGALFKATFNDKTYELFQTLEEYEAWKKKNKKPYTLTRAKGLGELTKEETYEQLVNPSTRNLHQLIADDMNVFNEYLEMFEGNDVAPRRDYLEEHFNDYEE